MKLKITLKIECGEKTCASIPGKFCHFLRISLNGKDSCSLFGNVFDKDGWIKRHPDCLKIAKK
jgi:hypothetical protein